MAEITIFRATLADADELYAHLRPADRAECEAYGKPSVEDGIQDSVKDSSGFCWTARREGALMAVFGVAPIAFTGQWGGFGSPWMLGTPLLDRHPRILQRLAPEYVQIMLKAFPHLMNFVHAKNTRSVRWLKRLGFHLHAPELYGTRGELFHRFEMHAHV